MSTLSLGKYFIMLRKNAGLVFCLFIFAVSFAQESRPKLIIGIVIDQMRWDYLYRYKDLYSPSGFKRLLGEGYSCENTFIPYVPSYTAVGHTCIYTGSVPAITGVIGNFWFDKSSNKIVYCTDDSTVLSVGTTSVAGKMSPVNMWTTTITDELRLSNNFKSKVIGISLKDRGAIFPAGHSANAAYWYDESIGKWITSSYYMNALTDWVKAFNDKRYPDLYINQGWNLMLPLAKYEGSTSDNMDYETPLPGEKTVTFPHLLGKGTNQQYLAFKYSPMAATYTFDFAKAAIENESLGNRNATDFLAISVSSTDYMGHNFGPNSLEAQDTYLRLDNDISSFLNYLDNKFGKGNYTLFLTADHGVAHVPAFLLAHKIPAGIFDEARVISSVNQSIEQSFGIKNVITTIQNYQVYLNSTEINKVNKDPNMIKQIIIDMLKKDPIILNAFELEKLDGVTMPDGIKSLIGNSYTFKRSGDIQIMVRPNYFDGYTTGTTHGLWNPYDTHIPLLWFGWGINHGSLNREVYMTDISPTLAALLKIQMPNGCIGKVITEVIKIPAESQARKKGE